MKVGVVGLGRMGTAICQRLASQGFDIIGWDRDTAALERIAGAGLETARNAAAVATEAYVVISSVTEDAGVRRLFTGKDGFLTTDVRDRLFIEMSTLQPRTSRELAPLVDAKGARLVELPVLGTIPSVREGKLLALAGGRPEDVERARPVLEKLARRIVRMGPHGSGYAMKLAVNLGLAAYIQGLAELLALGERHGLTLDQMLDVLSEAPTANGWFAAKRGTLKGEKSDVTLDIRTLRKDVMSAVATGALTGVGMPLSAGTLASLSAAVAHGDGAEDIGELPRIFRQFMGQSFD